MTGNLDLSHSDDFLYSNKAKAHNTDIMLSLLPQLLEEKRQVSKLGV